ncbi:hypothetical protein [Janthinobacterium sp. PC23-8]|uniref:hypothetical protein n=1 Tax=Janthinobacterium sp. PC23-8 TaxID=2012679 RepID=UPI000B979572|nr:hypothetical protein [Janthinobacterium sp. PC23-8]OYO29017.1 hypothetical protein CD932_17985 [Janthinobacterium sp. PC23-8]
MSDYYVWLEYFAAAPVSKNVKSDELRYASGHKHGVQPSQIQVDGLQPSLTTYVSAAYASYNKAHPAAVVAVPTNTAITAARTIKTRSAH